MTDTKEQTVKPREFERQAMTKNDKPTETAWSFSFDGHSLHLGQVEVVRRGPKTATVVSSRCTGHLRCVPVGSLYTDRELAVGDALKKLDDKIQKLSAEKARLRAIALDLTKTVGEFSSWDRE